MNADAFFRIGSSHDVCQDYAIARGLDAYVSDGCSSSPDTDWGARFMCFAGICGHPESTAYELAIDAAVSLGNRLRQSALDATCLGVSVRCDSVYVTMIGDGVTVVRFRDGSVRVRVRHYDGNCPFYARYSLSSSMIQGHRSSSPCSTWDEYRLPPGSFEWQMTQTTEPNNYDVPRVVDSYSVRDVELALVMSDGAESFTDADRKPIYITRIVEHMIGIKNPVGKFLTRRCHAFFSRHCTKENWTHHDDFSIAGIYCGDAP